MPTAKDRIQVLLEPEDYSCVLLLSKEEQRSHASMCAVLIREAINERRRQGLFTPPNAERDEALRVARLRRRAREQGLKTNELLEEPKGDKMDKLLDALSKLID